MFACSCIPDEANLCSMDQAVGRVLLGLPALAAAQVYTYGKADKAQQTGQAAGSLQFPYFVLTDLGEVRSEFIDEDSYFIETRVRADLYSLCPSEGMELIRATIRFSRNVPFEYAMGAACIRRFAMPTQEVLERGVFRTRTDLVLVGTINMAIP